MAEMPEVGAPGAPQAAVAAPVTVLPYRHEDPLFWISVYVAISLWLMLTLMTVGLVIPFVLFLGLLGLFARSLLVSWVRGNALRVGPEQFPDLHRLFQQSCQRLGVQQPPELYLCQADGMLNALAVRFMRRNYVVLLSNIVDALKDRPEAIKFYMGHELAHIQRKHLTRHWWLAPAALTPLLAPAYSRACEYTCDRYGLACCDSLEDAQRALVVLAAGSERWKDANLAAFEAQTQDTGRFWMAVNELTADYPWLCKRLANLKDRNARFPRRSAWAWAIAAFSPRLGYGGAVVGFLYLLMIGGLILALVLALVFSGSGLSEKIEEVGRAMVGMADETESTTDGTEDTSEEDTQGDESSSSADTEVQTASPPPSTTDMLHIGQSLAGALDSHAQAAKGVLPETLGELEGIEDSLSGVAGERWKSVDYGYATPAESTSGKAEFTLEAVCDECEEASLELTFRREKPGQWACSVTSEVEGVEVPSCEVAR